MPEIIEMQNGGMTASAAGGVGAVEHTEGMKQCETGFIVTHKKHFLSSNQITIQIKNMLMKPFSYSDKRLFFYENVRISPTF